MILKSKIHSILQDVKSNPSSKIESETIEFKCYRDERALHNSKDLTEELSALANKKGGVVIVGVRDDSDMSNDDWPEQLVGIDQIDTLQTKERIQGRLQPNIDIVVQNITYEGKNFAVIQIPSLNNTLISTSSGKTCIRDGRSSRPMTPAEIEAAVKSLSAYDWSSEFLDIEPSFLT